jgi:hypothetical protein
MKTILLAQFQPIAPAFQGIVSRILTLTGYSPSGNTRQPILS